MEDTYFITKERYHGLDPQIMESRDNRTTITGNRVPFTLTSAGAFNHLLPSFEVADSAVGQGFRRLMY